MIFLKRNWLILFNDRNSLKKLTDFYKISFSKELLITKALLHCMVIRQSHVLFTT